MEYALIALDLDGTLLNSRKEVSPRNRAALAAARQRGLTPVIATGRTPHSAQIYSQQIGGGYVICCNGAAILAPSGEYVAQQGISTAPLVQALELGAESGLLMECYTPEGLLVDRPLAHAAAYYGWIRRRASSLQAVRNLAQSWRLNRTRTVGSLARWAAEPDAPPVLKMMAFGERQRLDAFAGQLRQAVPGLEITSSEKDNLEITAAGVSKGSGLAVMSQMLQIPREAMIAMGDSENDLEMLRYVGLGVAMGNAADRVKAVADRVTRTCDEDGVAVLLEEVGLA